MVEYDRPGVVDRTDDIVRTVDVCGADDFNMVVSIGWHLCNDRRHILVNIRRQGRLDNEYVVVSLHCRNYSQIVHIAVPVEVKVGYDVGGVVEQSLKLPYGRRLGKGCGNCLKVKIQRNVRLRCVNLCRRGCHVGFRYRYHCAVGRKPACRLRHGYDSCRKAGYAEQCCQRNRCQSWFHC